ncbi:hypothetical protein F030043B2_12740 [Bacteroides fragilis]
MMSVIWLFNSPEESDCSLGVIGLLLSQALSSLPQDIKTKKNRLRKSDTKYFIMFRLGHKLSNVFAANIL